MTTLNDIEIGEPFVLEERDLVRAEIGRIFSRIHHTEIDHARIAFWNFYENHKENECLQGILKKMARALAQQYTAYRHFKCTPKIFEIMRVCGVPQEVLDAIVVDYR